MKNRRYFSLLFFLVLAGASAGVVMLLWNAILPTILSVRHITYWQALGLLVLCRILFSGFRFGGRGRRNRPPFAGPPSHVRGKWMHMSEEERTRFKEEWRKRCEGRKP